MKTTVLLTIISLVFLVSCTETKNRNNTHSVTPQYVQALDIGRQKIQSSGQMAKIYSSLHKSIHSGVQSQVLDALEALEQFTLNEENLTDPELNSRGVLRRDFREIMDLYGYGLAIAISKNYSGPRLSKLLHNYQVTILTIAI